MAIVKGPFQLSGSISNVSFYTRKDSDKVIMRTKGGVDKKKINRSPQYESFRSQQKEWSGCTKMAATVRYAMWDIHKLGDYNITPVLNSLMNKIQKASTEGEKGSRPVCLSNYKQALEGFNLNRKYPFNSILRVSTQTVLNRQELQAVVQVDRINPANDLQNVQNLPYFRLIATLGTVSDMERPDIRFNYQPTVPMMHGATISVKSNWYRANTIVEAHTLQLQFDEKDIAELTDKVTVMVGMGIEFGTTGIDGQPEAVKYAGSAKVLKVE